MSEHLAGPGTYLPAAGLPALRYTLADSKGAFAEWKATCGPHSIAAACSKTLDDVRRAMTTAGVNYRGWMSPTQVAKTLGALCQAFTLQSGLKTHDLCDGINRVQWEGKWLNPGVPPRIAYFHTHLVAHFGGWVLCTACVPNDWIRADEWATHWRSEMYMPFHITHHWTINR